MNKILSISAIALGMTLAVAMPASAQSLFDGGYVGAAGNYAIQNWDVGAAVGIGTVSVGGNGIAGEAFAGWGTSWDGFYVGVEGVAQYGDINITASDNAGNMFKLQRDGSVGINARAGYLPNDNTLLFVTGGIATNHYTATATSGGTSVSSEDWGTSYKVGAGVDTFITENVFTRVSYDVDFIDKGFIPGDFRTSTIKAGLGFRF